MVVARIGCGVSGVILLRAARDPQDRPLLVLSIEDRVGAEMGFIVMGAGSAVVFAKRLLALLPHMAASASPEEVARTAEAQRDTPAPWREPSQPASQPRPPRRDDPEPRAPGQPPASFQRAIGSTTKGGR